MSFSFQYHKFTYGIAVLYYFTSSFDVFCLYITYIYTFAVFVRSSFSRHHPTLALKQIKINPRASLDANQQKAKLNTQSKQTELFGDPFLPCYIGRDLVEFFFCFVSDKSAMRLVVKAARISAYAFSVHIVIAIGFGKNAKSSK